MTKYSFVSTHIKAHEAIPIKPYADQADVNFQFNVIEHHGFVRPSWNYYLQPWDQPTGNVLKSRSTGQPLMFERPGYSSTFDRRYLNRTYGPANDDEFVMVEDPKEKIVSYSRSLVTTIQQQMSAKIGCAPLKPTTADWQNLAKRNDGEPVELRGIPKLHIPDAADGCEMIDQDEANENFELIEHEDAEDDVAKDVMLGLLETGRRVSTNDRRGSKTAFVDYVAPSVDDDVMDVDVDGMMVEYGVDEL